MSAIVAARLRKMGWDVLTTHQAGHAGESDEAQLEFAAQKGRILVTRNYADFQNLHRQFLEQGRSHSGIIICFWRLEVQRMIGALINVLQNPAAADWANRLIFA